jgi:hypothetical protein
MSGDIISRRIPDRITSYSVQRKVLEQTLAYFRGEGSSRFEGFTCWSGRIEPDGSASVHHCAFPPPANIERHEFFAHLDLVATTSIAEQISSRGEFLLAQLHTHPGRAFHSSVDDNHSISQRSGFLSIVVPRFGLRKFYSRETLTGCSVNEHQGAGIWREWTPAEVRKRVRVIHGGD